jgi:hypothetical protein
MRRVVLLAALAVGLAGCSQPGTQLPYPGEAAKVGVATERIAVACGYAYQQRAFGGPNPPGLGHLSSIAVSGARKLAGVYSRYQSEIFQGESIGAVVHDSISLLGRCRLPAARRILTRALAKHG